jgi:hypothetical protein
VRFVVVAPHALGEEHNQAGFPISAGKTSTRRYQTTRESHVRGEVSESTQQREKKKTRRKKIKGLPFLSSFSSPIRQHLQTCTHNTAAASIDTSQTRGEE